MKVKIYTYADKRPDFIELQLKTLNFFLEDDFEYIVFNNGSNDNLRNQIQYMCKILRIKQIYVENPKHREPTIACAYPIQWSFHELIKHDSGCISCIIDSDMFLLKPFSIEKCMTDYSIAAVEQVRGHVTYLWNGIIFMNIDELPNKENMNFMFGNIEGENTDVGGHLYYWLKENPELKRKNIHNTSHICAERNNLECLPQKIVERYDSSFKYELYEHAFLHYGRGSNWDSQSADYHKRKTELLYYFLSECINGGIKL